MAIEVTTSQCYLPDVSAVGPLSLREAFVFRSFFKYLFSFGNHEDSKLSTNRSNPAHLVPASDIVTPGQLDPTHILTLVRSPAQIFSQNSSSSICAVKVTHDLVVKYGLIVPDSEALSMRLIKERTTILVPDVHLVIKDDTRGGTTYIVMDYIEGPTLDVAWPSLKLWQKLRIFWTLRGYVSQLRNLRRSIPGTLDYATCWGAYFTREGAGPFQSYRDFVDWFNHKLDVSITHKRCPPNSPRFESREPLVFCHMDLIMQNIILKNTGEVYIIDWQCAGFYPPSFEYVAGSDYRDPWDWRLMWPFIVGYHPAMAKKLSSIAWTLNVAFLL